MAAAPINWSPAVAARYQDPKFLGRGIFGQVYAAWDTVTKQLVAVKQLSGRSTDEFAPTGPVEFAQEVSALEACRGHPNVVRLVDSVDADADCGDRFIVMEFAGKVNLRRYSQRRRDEGRPFTEGEVRDAMAQLLSGVACVHRARVVHREVVPENVVVYDEALQQETTTTESNKRKKARVRPRTGRRAVGVSSSGPYRAPELFLGSTDYDERVDTWGIGCVMAELLAGSDEPFFGSGSDQDVLKGIARLDVVPDRRRGPLREAFPKEVLSRAGFDVLSGLLETNPRRRITAAAALKKPWFRCRGFGACFGSPVACASI
ncbi:hypothetical protein PR202_ga24346 [Eleusine coracana subsp. coracana]|uniref:[RNA-polymerase]-subunit kinase n=1 Tax=Eleusine coracana subsp. coracana TaxID=191504 RepID=A0AAV5D840_ELECO|nr:hypothetical protein PR202_ga24346 [Eleusine coracana subsp. coracana]